jgi:hypothetical protein
MTKVARVRTRWHTREALPPSVWRQQLKVAARWMLIAYATLFYVALAAALMT